MRRILVPIIVAVALISCSGSPEPGEIAVQSAKAYYDQLLQGDYTSFVAGTEGHDSIPEYYREQLVANLKMFIAGQKKSHGGIESVVALRGQADTIKIENKEIVIANAFLTFCYGDSTREEVVVPMINRDGTWLMR